MNHATATAILTTAVVDILQDADLKIRNVESSRDADHDVDAEPDDYTITGDIVLGGVTVAYASIWSSYPHANWSRSTLQIDWRQGF